MRHRLIDSIYKPLLDPQRVARTFRYFEERRGFRDYGEACRRSFRRQPGSVRPTALLEQGFEHLPVIGRAAARGLLAHIADGRAAPARVKKRSPRLHGHVLDVPPRRFVLDTVLTSELDARLIGFFESEYFVHWMNVTVTPPDYAATTVSFRWHCDKGPPDHLKLIVYLNGSDEHGGNTAFVPLADTARVAARGYVFGRTRSRTHHIAALSQVAGGTVDARQRLMRAGDGVMFQPARVLHRGVVPTRAPRYALTLCLLPSPVPWQEALARGVMADLAVDEKWPAHASELLTALQPED